MIFEVIGVSFEEIISGILGIAHPLPVDENEDHEMS
jgi:hypothetical protein